MSKNRLENPKGTPAYVEGRAIIEREEIEARRVKSENPNQRTLDFYGVTTLFEEIYYGSDYVELRENDDKSRLSLGWDFFQKNINGEEITFCRGIFARVVQGNGLFDTYKEAKVYITYSGMKKNHKPELVINGNLQRLVLEAKQKAQPARWTPGPTT